MDNTDIMVEWLVGQELKRQWIEESLHDLQGESFETFKKRNHPLKYND